MVTSDLYLRFLTCFAWKAYYLSYMLRVVSATAIDVSTHGGGFKKDTFMKWDITYDSSAQLVVLFWYYLVVAQATVLTRAGLVWVLPHVLGISSGCCGAAEAIINGRKEESSEDNRC